MSNHIVTMLYALLSAAKARSQPGLGLQTPPAFRSSLLQLRPSGSRGRAVVSGGAGRGRVREQGLFTEKPQTVAFPRSPGAVTPLGPGVRCPRGSLRSPCLVSQEADVFLPPARVSPPHTAGF